MISHDSYPSSDNENHFGSRNHNQSQPFRTHRPMIAISPPTDVMLPNIFVKIPLHNPTARSTVNRNGNEIKSENIKSEVDNVTAVNLNNGTYQSRSTQYKGERLVTARPKPIKCLKCTQCPFISLSQNGIDQHVRTQHDQSNDVPVKRKLSCPGCDNVFYSKKSLDIHLIDDHQMNRNEIQVLLQNIVKGGEPEQFIETNQTKSVDLDISESPEPPKTTGKQKIYLKNVENLKNPVSTTHSTQIDNGKNDRTDQFLLFDNRLDSLDNHSDYDKDLSIIEPTATMINDSHDVFIDLIDGTNNSDDFDDYMQYNETERDNDPPMVVVTNSEPSIGRNKIFVKNVDILKQPNPIESIQYLSETVSKTMFQSNTANIEANQSMAPRLSNEITGITPLINCISSPFLSTDPPQRDSEKKTYKIFIKNVDILKKPISLSPNGSCNNSMSPLVDTNLSPFDMLSALDRNAQDFLTVPHQTTSPTTLSSLSSSPSSTTGTMTPNPIRNNNQKKIFIKNIDILKEPIVHPLESRRGMLQLRPVEELSFHNHNQMQNLYDNYFEPTHDTTIRSQKSNDYTIYPDYNLFNEFPTHTTIEPAPDQNLSMELQDFVTTFQEPDDHLMEYDYTGKSYQPQVLPNLITIPADDQLNIQPEDISDSTSSMDINGFHPGQRCHSLIETPSRTDYVQLDETTIDSQLLNNYETAFDKDILFGCAEEIINSNATNLIDDIEYEMEPVPEREEIIAEIECLVSRPETVDNEKINDTTCRGRIYVVGNLLKDPQDANSMNINSTIDIESDASVPISVDNCDEADKRDNEPKKSKVRVKLKKQLGRPKGARQIGITQLKKLHPDMDPVKMFYQCDQKCAMRFKIESNLVYHRRCHAADKIQCPDCGSNEFKNWNTLHTHLWRSHSIDMELHACTVCSFRTPKLSHLLNTHMKIHSDERNFLCDVCDKAFKNNKQLKNHLTIHKTATIRKCEHCSSTFYNSKNLKIHIERHHTVDSDITYQCSECGQMFYSKTTLRMHVMKHGKPYKCTDCAYETNDHNSLRRHKMQHTKSKMYHCQFCVFQTIQSTTYKNHLLKKHPNESEKVIFSCAKCTFQTINRKVFDVHNLNHDISTLNSTTESNTDDPELIIDSTVDSQRKRLNINGYDFEELIPNSQLVVNTDNANQNKIKVKSNLSLTTMRIMNLRELNVIDLDETNHSTV